MWQKMEGSSHKTIMGLLLKQSHWSMSVVLLASVLLPVTEGSVRMVSSSSLKSLRLNQRDGV